MPASDRPDTPARLTWRLDALDTWRQNLDGRVAVLESKVGNIVFDDKLAQELADRLRARSQYQFTAWQKVLGGLVSLVVVAGEIKNLFGI